MHVLTLVTAQVPDMVGSASHSVQNTEFTKVVTDSVAIAMERFYCNTSNPDYLTFVEQTKEVVESYLRNERHGVLVRNLYSDMIDYAEKELGIKYCDEQSKFGYYINPNSYHDGYEFGSSIFLVNEDCEEYLASAASSSKAPNGYRWVCAARKSDVQWCVMRDCSPVSFEAFLQDGTLVHSPEKVDDFISSIDNDTVLVGLDCNCIL